jgi:hypothetical protein
MKNSRITAPHKKAFPNPGKDVFHVLPRRPKHLLSHFPPLHRRFPFSSQISILHSSRGRDRPIPPLSKTPNQPKSFDDPTHQGQVLPMNFSGLLRATACLLSCLGSTALFAQVNVLTYHNNNSRTGENLNETLLTTANVNSSSFGKLFSYAVDGYVFAQPLYVSGLSIPGKGVHNVLFIATEHNSLYAFDADSNTGPNNGLLWHDNLGTSAITPNSDFGTRYNNNMYTDIVPEVGITGTPVIDLASATLYVDAFTHEGSSYFHRLHAINITDGSERPNSPKLVNASIPGTGVGSSGGVLSFTHKQQLQRAALTLAGGILYVVYTGYADTNPYHGWILGFDPATLQQLTNYIFNTTPNSTVAAYGANAGEGGIWMGGNGLAVDANTNLYFEVGNGVFTATNGSGGTEYGDSFMKLSTSNGLAVIDYFTPYNQATLALNDTDLGSAGLMLLPDQPGSFPHLLMGSGKEGKIYLINRDQMTTGDNHYNATNAVDYIVQTLAAGKITRSFGTPAYFNGKIYYGGSADRLKAFSLTSGVLSANAVSTGPRSFPFPGATISVSANGVNNGIIWALQMGSPAVLAACNAANLTNEIYNSTQAAGNRDRLTNSVKFAVPTIANGKVYAAGQYSVSVFGLLSGNVAFSSPSYSAQENSVAASITVNRTGGTVGAVQVSYATVPGGTATEGIDYISTSGTLSWASGDATPKVFNIQLIDDNQAEPAETVNLSLSNPLGGYLGGQSAAVLTILEDPSESWRFAHFGTNANDPSISGDLADPDGDGAPNLLEYALAADPNAAGTAGSPTGDVAADHFQMHFNRNTSASDLVYIVQAADDLAVWSDIMTYTAAGGWVANTPGAVATESAPTGTPPDRYVSVTIIDPTLLGTPGINSRFFRLAVHR